MIDIPKLIQEWQDKLALARDPTEAALAKREIARLVETFVNGYTGGKSAQVFIIHGHDEPMRTAVCDFLKNIGLIPLLMIECADTGRTLIEKVIEESGKVVFAIALLSPDDLLGNGTQHARQNVIFETGYFMGKLGKSKVRMLVKQQTVIPGNLHGVLYDEYDETGAWKLRLLRELTAAGIINSDRQY